MADHSSDVERRSVSMRAMAWSSRMAASTLYTVGVLVVSVIALAGCGISSETQSESSPPEAGQTKPSAAQTAPGTSTALAPVDREVYELTGFLSPSGNVGCKISPTSVRCDIDQRDWSPPPRPADCRLDYGQGISIGSGGLAHFVCAGDTVRVLPPFGGAGEPLAYRQAIKAGPIRCESAESGITCRDAGSGHGFSISREAYQLF
ncbi:DUF6636 domain-containing protein [Mycobacterium simulans]|nr:DUF6636 domain-containing protein [Mycobacterium simulans]